MPFCPVPHTARDQAWLAVGVFAGALVARSLLRSSFRSAQDRRDHVWLVIEMAVHDPSRFFAAFNQLSASTLAEPGCVRYEILRTMPTPAEGLPTPLEATQYTVVSVGHTRPRLLGGRSGVLLAMHLVDCALTHVTTAPQRVHARRALTLPALGWGSGCRVDFAKGARRAQ